jgi:hypothetical protein
MSYKTSSSLEEKLKFEELELEEKAIVLKERTQTKKKL